MARKDEILNAFLTHSLLSEKYGLKENQKPASVRDALQSEIPIVKSIALVVENLENGPITDSNLRNIITAYLNESAI